VEHVSWARDLAKERLAEALPRRWAHSQGVGRKAESIAHVIGEQAVTLACAAWLHDIGYAPGLVQTGFHSLDGARYLRDVAQVDGVICRLVANHSHAIFEASRRGLADELQAEFPVVNGLLADAVAYCDMTTSPDGEPGEVESRLQEISERYEAGSIVADSMAEAGPRIIQSVRAVERAPGFQKR
jgi:HD domain